MSSNAAAPQYDFEVVIIGAGISGINSAYHIQAQFPHYSYAILEARDALGGTWDLFKYPGIRSDSDLQTFGFVWNPWSKPNPIAKGSAICEYLDESARKFNIDRHIQYGRKIYAANWSSEKQRWNLDVNHDGHQNQYTAKFVIAATGYYDYKQALKAQIPGLSNFGGKVIHPQFWPEDLDYSGKKVIIVGSGATAITLLPNMTAKAESVTMLQRSPSYIIDIPQNDPVVNQIRRFFPSHVAHLLVRYRFLIRSYIFFQFCRWFPNAAKRGIWKRTEKNLQGSSSIDPNFKPSYNPWDQRVCFCPDGDFYESLRNGKGNIVTDNIASVTSDGILTESGKNLKADIIITATGLKMQIAGGIQFSVDGKAIAFRDKYLWKASMVQDLPNMSLVIGYTNASWTLGAEVTAQLLCRLLEYMEENGISSVTPKVTDSWDLKPTQLLNLNSTYIEKAKGEMPKAGNKGPWLPKQSYFTDYWKACFGNLTDGLEFTFEPEKKNI